MASAMIPHAYLQVQLKPGIWCQMTQYNEEGVGAVLKKGQQTVHIPPVLWEALLFKMDLIKDVHQCIHCPTS